MSISSIPKLTDLMSQDYPKDKSERNKLVVGTCVLTGFKITDVPDQNFKQAINLDTDQAKYSTE